MKCPYCKTEMVQSLKAPEYYRCRLCDAEFRVKNRVNWEEIPEVIQPEELKQLHKDILTGEVDYEW